MAKGEGEGTEERENVKRKKKRVQKTNDRRRNGQYQLHKSIEDVEKI